MVGMSTDLQVVLFFRCVSSLRKHLWHLGHRCLEPLFFKFLSWVFLDFLVVSTISSRAPWQMVANSLELFSTEGTRGECLWVR